MEIESEKNQISDTKNLKKKKEVQKKKKKLMETKEKSLFKKSSKIMKKKQQKKKKKHMREKSITPDSENKELEKLLLGFADDSEEEVHELYREVREFDPFDEEEKELEHLVFDSGSDEGERESESEISEKKPLKKTKLKKKKKLKETEKENASKKSSKLKKIKKLKMNKEESQQLDEKSNTHNQNEEQLLLNNNSDEEEEMESKKEKLPKNSSKAVKKNKLHKKNKKIASKKSKKVLLSNIEEIREEKERMVSNIHELQQILGELNAPDENEKELGRLVLGGNFGSDEDDSEENECNTQKRKHDDSEDESPEAKKVPAWKDDDDETVLIENKSIQLRNCSQSLVVRAEKKYFEFLQEKFKKVVGDPLWAKLDRKDIDCSDDENEDLLKKTGDFIKTSEHLRKKNIQIQRCPNLVDPNCKNSAIKSVEFNSQCKVALIAGVSQTVNLFQIDGKINAKIQSIFFQDFPVYSAHFTPDGHEIIAGSNKFNYFYSYDMMVGKISKIPLPRGLEQNNIKRFCLSPNGKYIIVHGRYGNIHIMTSKTKEWVGSLKMNGEVVAITFNHDGSKLYSHGVTGEVYVWDMLSRKCLHKFIDEGCMAGTSIAVSPNDQYLACGSDSGIVNIYDNRSILNTAYPQPIKVITNLTTDVTDMKFNHSSELLAISSSKKSQSIRLVHFPSMTVFSNFPDRELLYSIKKVHSLDISVNSGYVCFGNHQGSASVLRLNHFKNY